jgi:hypothetical protein
MDLVRDVLDKQIVDRESDRMGKVDGLVVAIAEDGPPRVIAIEVGPVTLARRLSRRLADRIRRVLQSWGAGDGVTRFATAQVVRIDIEVTLDVRADETEARKVEHWLRDHVVRRIPGSAVKG